MTNRVVVGAQWGDEGKAKVVDFLTEEADYVIRFQGGANAGHTVVVGNEKYVFHLIPSGLMHPGKVCVIGNGVVLDPAQLLKELAEVTAKGIDPGGRLFLAENAQVVFPWHKVLDQLKEKAAGKDAIGTTGRGIGPCYNDKVSRNGIRVLDLLDEKSLREKVIRQTAVNNHLISRLYGEIYEGKPLDPDAIFAEYRDLGVQLRPLVADTVVLLNEALRAKQRLLFEGAQGTILDVDHGTYPFVTSSNTIAAAACTGSGVGPTAIQQVIGVVKAYTTRVGNGPFPTEIEGEMGEHLRVVGGEYGATTGRNRRCGWFDAVVVRRAALVNGLTHLAITKMDVLDTWDTIEVCTAYRCDGKSISHFPNSPSVLERCQPIYETLPGWKQDTTGVTRWEELPRNAQHYLARLSDLVGVPMGLLSLGPKRHQTIELGM
jgi:adenylosuccinate synthase